MFAVRMRVSCRVFAILIAAVLIGTTACSSPEPEQVASVTLSPTSGNLLVGQTATLTAVARNASGATISDTRPVTWASTSPSVASVSGAGVVTAVSPGATTISATIGGQSGSAQFTIIAPVASVLVLPATTTMAPGATATLSATPRDAGGVALSGREVQWTSSNSSVATVSQSGLVTAVASGGPVTITATSEGQSGVASVTVLTPAANVVVTPASSVLEVGRSVTLAATVSDAAGNTLTGRSVSWSSSNPAIATVSQQGVVTGVAVGGPITITATSDGRTGTAVVSVANAVASIAVSPPVSSIEVGRTVTLSATARDAQGTVLTGRPFTWASSAPSVATVSASGVVTAVAAGGPVTITASAEGRSGTAQVTATPASVSLRLLTQTTEGRAGSALAPGFTLQVVDGAGDVVSAGSYDVSAQLSLTTGYIGTLAGSVTKQTQSGSVRFDDLRVTAPGVYSLSFRVVGQTSAAATTQSLIIDASNPLVADRVSSGFAASCASASPRAYCWGSNSFNRISPTLPGGATSSLTAFEVSVGEPIAEIVRGFDDHSCLLTVLGKVYCIGRNSSGNAFVSTSTSTVTSWRDAGVTAASLALGDAHTCLLSANGDAACVGEGSAGRLGTGLFTDQFLPTLPVAGGFRFTAITAGSAHTCGLVAFSAYCWGDGGNGKLGVGNTTDYPSPQLVGSGLRFVAISAGQDHTCAITDGDGALFCWGRNSSGQLGDGTTTGRLIPQRVIATNVRFTQLSVGAAHTCAVDDQNRAWCFGANGAGRLGFGSTATLTRTVPVLVLGPPFRQVSAGSDHTCGITVTGTVWCWGEGSNGRLGNGATTNTGTPLPVIRP